MYDLIHGAQDLFAALLSSPFILKSPELLYKLHNRPRILYTQLKQSRSTTRFRGHKCIPHAKTSKVTPFAFGALWFKPESHGHIPRPRVAHS